jgi:hypothetical protein
VRGKGNRLRFSNGVPRLEKTLPVPNKREYLLIDLQFEFSIVIVKDQRIAQALASGRSGSLVSGMVDELDGTGNTHGSKETGIPTNYLPERFSR